MPRIRHIGSVKNELILKAREAMLSAVQIFNNPNMQFKSESFCVLSVIAWTYLLHAYFRGKGVEYRYHEILTNGRKKFDKTKRGAYKFWELEQCLNRNECPIDKVTAKNLRFLIGLRHEIEHQMTTRIDEFLSARFQACCLNFNQYIKKLHGPQYGIEQHLTFSLQFSSLSDGQVQTLRDAKDLPANISSYIAGFDAELSESDFTDSRYSYRVFFVQKTANHKGQADRVIEYIRPDSEAAIGLNREQILIRDREKPKLLPAQIVSDARSLGYTQFRAHEHTQLWKSLDAKNPGKGFGVQIAKTWYWYENWRDIVIQHCKENYGREVSVS